MNLFERADESVNSNDQVEQILVKFSKHRKQKVKINRKFFFQPVSEDTVNVLKNLPSDKATAGETLDTL